MRGGRAMRVRWGGWAWRHGGEMVNSRWRARGEQEHRARPAQPQRHRQPLTLVRLGLLVAELHDLLSGVEGGWGLGGLWVGCDERPASAAGRQRAMCGIPAARAPCPPLPQAPTWWLPWRSASTPRRYHVSLSSSSCGTTGWGRAGRGGQGLKGEEGHRPLRLALPGPALAREAATAPRRPQAPAPRHAPAPTAAPPRCCRTRWPGRSGCARRAQSAAPPRGSPSPAGCGQRGWEGAGAAGRGA